MSYNAGERKDVRRLEKESKLADQNRREFMAGVMSTQPGRLWMFDKLQACHIFASSFTTNALQTAFAEGERNVGLQLLNDIMQACPDQYVLMMKEANARSTLSERRGSERADGRDQEPSGAGSATGDEDSGDDSGNEVQYDA